MFFASCPKLPKQLTQVDNIQQMVCQYKGGNALPGDIQVQPEPDREDQPGVDQGD